MVLELLLLGKSFLKKRLKQFGIIALRGSGCTKNGLRCALIRRTRHGCSYLLPRFRSLAIFVRRPRVLGIFRDAPASENHHNSGHHTRLRAATRGEFGLGEASYLLPLVGKKNGPPGGAKVDSIGLNCWQIQRLVDKRGRAFEIEIAIDVLLHDR